MLGHIVRFVDDNNVPVSIFQVRSVFGTLFQRIDGDNCLIVIIKGIVVGRDTRAYSLNADRVQAHEWYRKTDPNFLLELGQHAFDR